MASAGVKGFFREKKKAMPGAAKKSKDSASSGSDAFQPPALISHATVDLQAYGCYDEEYDEKEEVLRQFDMNMAYGACIGMNRLERWERANKLGLNPPAEDENLLRMEKTNYLCLWDGQCLALPSTCCLCSRCLFGPLNSICPLCIEKLAFGCSS